MIAPIDLQEAWIAYLKSIPATISPVTVAEVREDSWKGEQFAYPNIRIKVDHTIPDINPNCNNATGLTMIEIFSEQKSSKEADTIAKNIATYLHGRKFTASGIKFAGTIVEQIGGAVAQSDLVWKAEIQIRTLMS